ncbi:MAG: tyrosine-type recombinase/integrase, partial [Acidobacteriota bacterium]
MPKKVVPLSEVAVRNAKPQAKPYKLADGGGLYLEVLPTGGKSWRVKYRYNNKEKRIVLGLWPSVSLKMARERREEIRSLLANGKDPHFEIHAANARSKTASETFETISREWFAHNLSGLKERTAAEIIRRFEKNVFPWVG